MKYEYFKHVSYEILNKYFNFLKTDLLFGESKNIPYATFIYKNRGILSDDLVITLNTIFTKNSISGMYLSHGIEVEVNNIERYVF